VKKFIKQKMYPIVDFIVSPFTLLSSILLKVIRRRGIKWFPIAKKIFLRVGVFPIWDHYYEPLFSPKDLHFPLDEDRNLPGIDWNVKEQLSLLQKFDFNDELRKFPVYQKNQQEFYYNNVAYGSGDSEILYSMIRHFKPRKIIEIGSGNSTLMAKNAIRQNKEESAEYNCLHICIEPFEAPWLEDIGVKVIRKRVEELENNFFAQLRNNDLLFIDSSHIIRPQGDVLFEYLEVLPILNTGVIVHSHDIFSPKDYLCDWIYEDVRFWNEQYLLEAFLSCNTSFKVIAALNFLHHNYYKELALKCPMLTQEREPGAFYIQKV